MDTGHWVLLVTARTPGTVLLRRLPELGVPLEPLVILDVTAAPGAVSPDPEHLHYVPSPSLLEMLTLRGERTVWKRRKQTTRIATLDLNSFARHNPPDALEQIVRYTLSRIQPYTLLDYFVAPDRPLPPRLLLAMEALCGAPLPLEAVTQRAP